ncbi:hypothetical protein SPBR_06120 [Sporothrix brasiliensis 5110]|uniref:Uncharacterized protein n=1 Tax=Sporothrix brasiliensis 5110 TaxID=1398154 RepID=A0A0C2JBY6_9PEZI|nr:uncharacterized protein SPBR_06120 [Sporothrix brasiliensis 5110]KIH94422.1 hypothetical protein SPBR_06120 [Sporothrix brasiliensis 5110]
MALFAAVLMLAAPAMVMADDNVVDSATSGPLVAAPMGHGPVVPPVINASFTSSFDDVTQGQTLNLAWNPIDTKYEPLSITARAINRTADSRANSFLVTIAPHLTNTSSFSWSLVPFPLQYMHTGIYEVEIRPAIWNLSANEPGSLTVPVLARSTFFTIGDNGQGGDSNVGGGSDGDGANGNGSDGSSGKGSTSPNADPDQLAYGQSETKMSDAASAAAHKRLALGLGISLGAAGALALASLLYVVHRRHSRRVAETQRLREKREASISEL